MLTKIEMDHTTPYSKIKVWFEENLEQMPGTLDGECKYYRDLKFTIKMYMDQIAHEYEKYGSEINKRVTAKAAKNNLVTIWRDLQDQQAWNLGMAKSEEEARKRTFERRKFHQT